MGAVSGTVGPVVGSTWKGIPYLRSKPERRKSRKKTAGEIATTTSFGFLSKFLKPFQPYIKIGFMHYATEQTERNAAHAENHNNKLISPYPDLAVDYSRLILSKGSLPGILNPVMTFAEGTISIQWEANLVGSASGSDQIMLSVYDKRSKTATGFIGAAPGGPAMQLRPGSCDAYRRTGSLHQPHLLGQVPDLRNTVSGEHDSC